MISIIASILRPEDYRCPVKQFCVSGTGLALAGIWVMYAMNLLACVTMCLTIMSRLYGMYGNLHLTVCIAKITCRVFDPCFYDELDVDARRGVPDPDPLPRWFCSTSRLPASQLTFRSLASLFTTTSRVIEAEAVHITPAEAVLIRDAKTAFMPVLPPFPYQCLDSVQFCKIRFGDQGMSVVQVEVCLTAQLNPYRPVVNITLTCSPVYPKRILSATLKLTFPNNDVLDISPESELGPETETVVERRDATTATAQLGASFAGANVGGAATWESSVQRTATRRTQLKIHGFRRGVDTAQWSIQEDSGDGGRGGLPNKVNMSLVLNHKPTLVRCDCLIQVVEVGGRICPHRVLENLLFDDFRRLHL